MNQEEFQKVRQDLIYLVACAVKEIKPDPELVKAMDLSAVFSLAKSQSLSGAAAFAVEAAGFRSGTTTKLLSDVVHRNTRFTIEKDAITQKLKEAGIWYVLLKGAVIKDYYPRPEMREMSDHDILFDASRAEDVKAIMESLGYTTEHFNVGAHDIYFKAPVMNFEMHRMLFSAKDEVDEMLEEMSELLLSDTDRADLYSLTNSLLGTNISFTGLGASVLEINDQAQELIS